MLKNLANLIKVKTIVTFVVLAVWAYLSIVGTIAADAVNNNALMVIAFYFVAVHEKNVDASSK